MEEDADETGAIKAAIRTAKKTQRPAKIGEKLELKEAAYFDGTTHTYLHRRSQDLPPQVGVLVEYEGDDEAFVHGVALQIASMMPQYVSRDEIPEAVLATEKEPIGSAGT